MGKPDSKGHKPLPAATPELPGTTSFPFLRLPTELRIQIWKHHCPDLCEVPRLLDFKIQLLLIKNSGLPPMQHIFSGLRLADRTRSLRCVLAVHQQSRSIALAVFPDKLSVSYGSVLETCDVPFHKQRDIAYLRDFGGEIVAPYQRAVATMVGEFAQATTPGDHFAASAFRRARMKGLADALIQHTYAYDLQTPPILKFYANVVNLAYEYYRPRPFPYLLQGLTRGRCPNLKNVFLHLDDADIESLFIPIKHRWCASEYSSHDVMMSDESDRCLVRAYWPNLTQHAEYARSNLAPSSVPELIPNLKDIACFFEIFDVQVWPMVVTDPSKFTAHLDCEDDCEDDSDEWSADEGSDED